MLVLRVPAIHNSLEATSQEDRSLNSLEVTRCTSLGGTNHSNLEAINHLQEATILLQSSSRWFPLPTLLTIPHRILDPQPVIKIPSQTSKLLTILMQCD